MPEETCQKSFNDEELKVLVLAASLIISGKIKVDLPPSINEEGAAKHGEKHDEYQALLHRDLQAAVQGLKHWMEDFDINQHK